MPLNPPRCHGYHRFIALIAIFCSVLASLNFIYLWHLTNNDGGAAVSPPRQRLTSNRTDEVLSNSLTLPPRCPAPNFNLTNLQQVLPESVFSKLLSDWDYYTAISHENDAFASRVRNFTIEPISTTHRADGLIPHRLIFTHRLDLFDCNNSASESTAAPMYTLAENAKATVRAYAEIWDDLEYVFLTDVDCVDAVREAMPELVGWFQSPMTEGV